MSSYRRLGLLLLPLLVLNGCGDSTSVQDLNGLEPSELNSAVMTVVDRIEASSEATANLGAARQGLVDQGFEFDRVEPTVRGFERVSSRAELATLTTPLPLTIPPEIQGETFVYDPAELAWVIAEGRTGAPADGLRVIWYDLDGTGQVLLPLAEQGYIDLAPAAHPTLDALSLRAVDTSGGSDLVLLDFVQAHASTGGDMWTEAFEVVGTYADSVGAVQFWIVSEGSGDDSTGDEDYLLDVSLQGTGVDYSLESEGVLAGGEYEDFLTATVDRSGGTTVLELSFIGTEGEEGTEDVAGTLVHDGELVANIGTDGNAYSFSTPGGDSFSASQSNQLNALFQTLFLGGFALLFRLPLFFLV